MNERIRAREVRVIGEGSENYGVIPFAEAMTRAREAGLDLVEVDANSQPPVCRILDYGKFKYEQAKRERDARKHQRGTMIHEVRLRPRTGQHDIDLKVRIATRLLSSGDKVKLSVMFRGREISHPEVGREVLDKAIKGLGDTVAIEKPPGMEGRFLTVIVTPTAKKPAAKDEAGTKAADKAAGNGKKTAAKAQKAVETKVEAKVEAKGAPAKVEAKAEAKVEAKAAPTKVETKAEAKVEAKAAPAKDGDADAAKKATPAKKDEA